MNVSDSRYCDPCEIMTAKEWLIDYLIGQEGAPAEVGLVMTAGMMAGFHRRDLRAAAKDIGVVRTNNWTPETRKATEWYWQLPEAPVCE